MNGRALAPTLDALRTSWAEAADVSPLIERSISVAGLTLGLVSAGSASLDVLWPALSHHPVVESPPDVTVHLWDLASTGASRPPLPAEMFDERATELRDIVVGDTATVRFEPASQSLTAWVPARRAAWCCVAAADGIVWWDQAAPFRSLLSWWLEASDRQLIHGAAVGDENGAVVLAGPGGSGKSTTALACHRAGMGFLGDDYCAISMDPDARVHSLYSTAKLRLDDHQREGILADRLLRSDPRPGEKAVVLVDGLPGTRVVESAPVRAVVAVRVGDGDRTRVLPASKASVLAALAPSSILQLPGVGQPTFAGLAQLVRSVPVAMLELGRDRDEIIDVVAQLASGNVGE